MGFKWGVAAGQRYCAAPQRPADTSIVNIGRGSAGAPLGRCAVSGHDYPYAMNMRAAEAIVSSAPKPMKIFPIREV
jgi:hypothetical protein